MAEPASDPVQHGQKSGLPSAIGAYTIWGFFPLYLILVSAVPPFEFVAWRIIWTVPICALIVLVRRLAEEGDKDGDTKALYNSLAQALERRRGGSTSLDSDSLVVKDGGLASYLGGSFFLLSQRLPS